MGGQAIERRDMMRLLALASAAAQFGGFAQWTFGCGHVGQPASQPVARYQPQFFSAREYSTVERLADLIVPSDGTPGAREAGASEFIDFMVAHDESVQYRFRYGLAWLDAHAVQLSGRPFVETSAPEQSGILEALAYRDRHRPGQDEGRAFFSLMRSYTVMGFYTSRIGLEQLDYPGFQLYAQSPGCPNPDDPDHRHEAPRRPGSASREGHGEDL
ncbi:MAG: gluconate 2-dehydrogenase subunit 3 family protein [Acidobacteriota bacterium]